MADFAIASASCGLANAGACCAIRLTSSRD